MVADRVAVGVAERMIADRVRQQIADQGATPREAGRGDEGVPFLTQVLEGPVQGDQDRRCGTLTAPVAAAKPSRMPLLDVRARDVRAPLDTLRTGSGDIVAATVTGAGTIDYDSVAELLDQPGLKLAEQDGKLAVTAPADGARTRRSPSAAPPTSPSQTTARSRCVSAR